MIPSLLVLAALLAAEPTPTPADPTPAPTESAPPVQAPAPALPAPPPPAGPVLSLEEALKTAEAKNLDLQQARARLVQTEELSAKVWANYLPQISVGGSYTLNQSEAKITLPTGYWVRELGVVPPDEGNGPPFDPSQEPSLSNPPGAPATTIVVPSGLVEATIQEKHQWGGQLQINQALIVPALWPGIANARLGEKVAAVSVESARREILFGVAQLYYACVNLRELIDVRRQLLENTLAHERDARVRVEAGALPRIGLLRAEIDRARAEQDLVQAQKNYQSTKIALGTLLDREEDFEVSRPAEPAVPDDAAPLLESAQTKRPDLEAARLSAELADRVHTATYYNYLPNLVASFTYRLSNVTGFTGEHGQWALMLGANWTIWDGGVRESQLRENEAKAVEARAALRKAQIAARDDVRRALLELESSRANRIKASEQVRLARENMQLITVNYQAGAATQIEVSDATTALAGAELSLVTETLNAELAALRLLKAAGQFAPQP